MHLSIQVDVHLHTLRPPCPIGVAYSHLFASATASITETLLTTQFKSQLSSKLSRLNQAQTALMTTTLETVQSRLLARNTKPWR